MLRRTLIALTTLALGGLILTGCTTDTTGSDSTTSATTAGETTSSGTGDSADLPSIYQSDIPRPAACDEDSPYIAVALPNLTNPYYVAMKKGFEEAGASAGFTVEVQIANDDDATQLAQAQTMLQKKPCALALNAVKSEPAAAIVKAANDAGVPVFTVNVIVSEEALIDQGAQIVQYLGADNYAGGQQTAEQVLKDMGADATLKIGFITEPDEVPVLVRDEGFEDAIASNPNAEVVAKVDGNVKPDDSMKVTTELMSGHPDVNVLFASTGPASYGALQALAAGNYDTKIYGFCAADEPLTDTYPACVAQEPEDYGKRVVEQVKAWLDGGTPEQEILRPLKMFVSGETPAPGEVG